MMRDFLIVILNWSKILSITIFQTRKYNTLFNFIIKDINIITYYQ